MHERKAAMAREADAFIALPGNHLENSHQYSFKRKQTITLSVLFLETVEIFLYKLEIVILGVVLQTYLFLFLMVFRRIWNHGRTVGDDNMGPTWNS